MDDVMSFFDHAFFINLDYRTDRLKQILTELKNVSIEAERVSGIREKDERYWQPYNYGCKLSHMKVLDIAEERGYNRILVLEDDAIFHNDFWNILNKASEQIKDIDWDILFLGAKLLKHHEVSENLTKLIRFEKTHAYIAKRETFQILRQTMNDTLSIDKSWSNLKLKAFCVLPKIVEQDGGKSDIKIRDYGNRQA